MVAEAVDHPDDPQQFHQLDFLQAIQNGFRMDGIPTI